MPSGGVPSHLPSEPFRAATAMAKRLAATAQNDSEIDWEGPLAWSIGTPAVLPSDAELRELLSEATFKDISVFQKLFVCSRLFCFTLCICSSPPFPSFQYT